MGKSSVYPLANTLVFCYTLSLVAKTIRNLRKVWVHTMKYQTKGVCSSSIDIEVEGDVIKFVEFFGGCNGNLKGIASLVAGMKVDDAIAKLKGIRCGFKTTSCPDQLAQALEQIKNGNC